MTEHREEGRKDNRERKVILAETQATEKDER